MFFKIIGRISEVEKIASDKGLRERRRLRKLYGGQRWRKLKGTVVVKRRVVRYACRSALVRSHGIGAREFKIKRILEIQ